jgi:tetratricopeptide (TPR) repeat protein
LSVRSVIAATEHVVAIEQELGGDTVFVTFNEMGYLQKGDRFWGDDLFAALGVSAIGFVTPRPNWYPAAAMDEVLATVRARIGARRVVTYGHSQGGYGALKFAERLNASLTLSFCPQWSIDPAAVGSFDDRFTNYFHPSLANGLAIGEKDLGPASFVFYDKQEPRDSQNVQKLVSFRGVRAVVAPFTMHESVQLIAEGHVASKLLRRCAESGALPRTRELRQLVRAGRRDSPTYYLHMRNHLVSRAHRSKAFLTALLRARRDAEAPLYEALLANAEGDEVRARALVDGAIEDIAGELALLRFWSAFGRFRFLYGEQRIAERICATVPDHVFAGLHAVHTFIRFGQYDVAAREVERLSKLDGAVNHIGHFVEFAAKLDRPEIIESFLSPSLQKSERIAVGFRLAELYRLRQDRRNSFRKLAALAEDCKGSPAALLRIGDMLMEIGETSFALEIRRRLLRTDPTSSLYRMNVLESEILGGQEGAIGKLDALLQADIEDPAIWERASHIYELREQPQLALRAIQAAVKLRKDSVSARQRLIHLLLTQRNLRAARAELRKVLAEGTCSSAALRHFGSQAVTCNDPALVMEFAEAQHRPNRLDPEAILYLANACRVAGDAERARQLLTALFESERRFATLSEDQLARLAQELLEVEGSRMAKETAIEVLARNPNSEAARRVKTSVEFYEKHGIAAKPAAPAPKAAPRRLGLVASIASSLFGS